MRAVLSAFILGLAVCLFGVLAASKPLFAQEACHTVADYAEESKKYPGLVVETRDSAYLGRFLLLTGIDMPANSKATTVMVVTGPNAVVIGLIEPDGCVSNTLVIPRAHFDALQYRIERGA